MLDSEEAIKYLEEYDSNIDMIKKLLYSLGYQASYSTSLYADWIYKIMQDIKDTKTRRQIQLCKNYLSAIKDGFSLYYHQYVREDMWMGIRTFHLHMKEMIENIDYENANYELLSKIYGNINYSIDYAENAFLLAAYMLGIKKEDEIEIIDFPSIKILSNI